MINPNIREMTYGGAWSIRDAEVLDYIRSIDFFDQYDTQEFCKNYRSWAFDKKNIAGLERFSFLDFSNGTTETFDKFYQTHLSRRLRCLPGEYYYHTMQGRNIFKQFSLIGNEPIDINDVVVMSCPFADTGNTPSRFNSILDECEKLNVPVLIDMAYLNISDISDINLDYDCIDTICTSMSKVFPVQHHRIGLRLRQKFKDDTLYAYNKVDYVNKISVGVGMKLINKFSNDYIIQKYKSKQKELCHKLNIIPSESVIFGIDQLHRYDQYNRGGSTNRLCFSKSWNT